MSIAISELDPEGIATDASPATDSIVAGLSVMLVANVFQRGIGFVRNIVLCRFLADDHLGLWALCSSFFILAAPLAVLGLPGTFGRMVETYRASGQLSLYLKRIAFISSLGVMLFLSCLVGAASTSSSIIFGSKQSHSTMFLIALTLCLVILFNATTELLSGLRRSRIVSAMHTCNSLVFTVTSLLGLWLVNDWRVLVVAFAIAAMAGLLPAISILRKWRLEIEPTPSIATPFREMWRRVLPFAISVWCMNLLTNLFDVVDRYMLLYLATDNAEQGRALVGQFHSGRIMPVLLSSLTLMISGLLLPYLAADWEAGKHKEVSKSLRLTLKCAALFFLTLSVFSLALAPMLFENVLQGKYAEGLAIMPQAMLHCCWAALAFLMQNYFWCAERGKTVGTIIGIGLGINVVLNACLVPSMSLFGAMLATSISGGAILLMTLVEMRRSGVLFNGADLLFCLLPVSLAFGCVPAALTLAVATVVISRTNWLLSAQEKWAISEAILPRLQRFGLHQQSLWHLS